MGRLLVDARAGATVAALLGGLVEAGASLEAVEAATSAIGAGPVKVAMLAGERRGTSLRLLAPAGAPRSSLWRDLRPRVALLAVDPDVARGALATLDALMAARAQVHGVDVGRVELDPLGAPEEVGNAVALAAAVRALGPDDVLVGPVGHGTAARTTLEGTHRLPGPVVEVLLRGRPASPDPAAGEVVDPLAAAWLRAAATPCSDVDGLLPVPGRPGGRGRLDATRRLHVRWVDDADPPQDQTSTVSTVTTSPSRNSQTS